MGNVPTWRIKAQVPVDGAVISRADFERALDNLRLVSLKCDSDWLFNYLKVSLGEQFNVDVLNGFAGTIDENNLEFDVIVVHFCDGFCVDWIGIACQLVNLLVDIALDLFHVVA